MIVGWRGRPLEGRIGYRIDLCGLGRGRDWKRLTALCNRDRVERALIGSSGLEQTPLV